MGPAAARLEVVAGKAAGMSLVIDDELIIGRHAEGAGQLAQDDEISRQHARVICERGGACTIEDLGSTNGTFVNGLKISVPQILAEGDMIEMGATTLVVRELPQPEPPAATDIHPQPADDGAQRHQPTLLSDPGSSATAPEPEPVPPPIAEVEPIEEPTARQQRAAPEPQPWDTPPPPGPGLWSDRAPDPEPEPEPWLRIAEDPAPETPAEPETWAAQPEPEPEPEPVPPILSLSLEVDFAAREARLYLNEQSEPVRLVFEAGAWRSDPSLPDPERRPA